MGANQKRKQPVKTKLIELEEDYAGWNFLAQTNPPTSLFADISSGEFSRIVKALSKVIRSWNYVDVEGIDLAEPSFDTINELPIDLLTATTNAYISALTELPPA